MELNQFLEKYAKKPVNHYPNKVVDRPLVSVCVQTYQHAPYIKECLDSILMQQTHFDFEILLGEDASTDGTRDICIEYAKKYPDKIRLFLHHRENNIAINGRPSGRFNLLYNLFSTKGKYVALCEGDDYWTDPLKLQKQVEFLEKNKECSIVFHACKRIKNGISRIIRHNGNSKMDLNNYLIQNPFPATASLLFKTKIVENYQKWMIHLFAADFVIRYLSFLEGNMGYIDEVMCIYNKGVDGSWSATRKTAEKVLREYKDNYQMLRYMESTSLKIPEETIKIKRERLRSTTIIKIAASKKLISQLCYLFSKKGITYREILRYIKFKLNSIIQKN